MNDVSGQPVIIEVAVNGAKTREQQPHVPLTPAEVAADEIACIDAGATIIHNHTGDPVIGGSGAGLLARAGGQRLQRALDTARAGISAMASAVEHNDSTSAVKAQMSRVSNPEVEAVVAARQVEWDTRRAAGVSTADVQ